MSQEKEVILKALGGKRGLIDNGLPSIVFLIAYNIIKDLQAAIYAAIALSGVLTVIRLAKRDTLQHALSGVIGVLICAWFANRTGQPKDYYKLSLFRSSGFAMLYTIANLIGWPILGLILGPILGENFEWRKHPARKKVYMLASWVWVGMFLLRFAVMAPLYFADKVNALGAASLILGYPLYLLVIWWTWLIIKTVPTVKPDSAEVKPE